MILAGAKRQPWELTREMFLSEHEVESLLRFLDRRAGLQNGPETDAAMVDSLIVQGLLFSGMRNSEFCRLTVADTIAGTGQSVLSVRGTPRQDRVILIPDAVSSLIMDFVAQVRPRLIPDESDPSDQSLTLIFNERRRPYERTGLYRRVVRILKAAGFGDRASVQLLRHTYGYLAYKRSAGNLLFVQRQLGHAHPMVTSVYADFVDEDYGCLANQVYGDVPS